MKSSEEMISGKGNELAYSADNIKFTELTDAKLATRLAFFIAGFGLACWAPLVPFAQSRMQAEPALLGAVLLCLGLGALIGMPAAGGISAKAGSRMVIIMGAVGIVVALPLLALLSTPLGIGAALFLFGLSIGATDVAANIHGSEVQDRAGMPLMSGFHGFYSVGGLAGAVVMTLLIATGLHVFVASMIAIFTILICLSVIRNKFLRTVTVNDAPLFVLPKGKVIVVGLLAMVMFLAEGAMLDWGALLLIQEKSLPANIAGSGYVVFAVAMTLSRFVGDRLVSLAGERWILTLGVIFTAIGLLVISLSSSVAIVFSAIAIAGFAAGNVVPILFTRAGKQDSMAPSLAISAASMLGYLGVLMGPAAVGFIAHYTGLANAFCFLSALVMLFSLTIISIFSGKKTL